MWLQVPHKSSSLYFFGCGSYNSFLKKRENLFRGILHEYSIFLQEANMNHCWPAKHLVRQSLISLTFIFCFSYLSCFQSLLNLPWSFALILVPSLNLTIALIIDRSLCLVSSYLCQNIVIRRFPTCRISSISWRSCREL